MKAKPEYVEGAEALTRFQNAMRKVIAGPHSEIQRRTAQGINRQTPLLM